MSAQGLNVLLGGKPPEMEYVQFHKLSALVIDDISSMRHAIRAQLQSIGMNQVSVATNADEALEKIKTSNFDLILCDYNLNKVSSGQHFLEYLRTEKLLDATSIFVMLTAEAEYSFVANAVEFAPDDYLLKPCSENKLRSRLVRLIDRRAFLMPALLALNERKFEQVIAICDKLLTLSPDERRRMDVLKRKAEAQFVLGQYAEVLETYAQAAATRSDVPWVALGAARAHFELKKYAEVADRAAILIEKHPNYVAAYELLANARLEMDEEEAAYELLQRSSDILPSAKRFRSVAQSAYLLGKLEEAKSNAEAAIRLSNGSMVERSGDYLSLSQAQVDMGDHAAAIQTLEKNARKYGEEGIYGVAKCAILAQAYVASGDKERGSKLMARAVSLMGARKNSFVMTVMGKAALKVGDVALGLKLLTQSVQFSGKSEKRIARHVRKSMLDTGHQDKVEDVIDGGRKRILLLVEEATRLMRSAHFSEAHEKLLSALDIHSENLEALLSAAQLHLLWLKQGGLDAEVLARTKLYLSTLDRLLPSNQKVMNFYRYFNEIVGA
ncbi:MAG: response regulator [Gallionella sp.]|nr:response regulator [Gallionella sp.]MDD4946712.1 response regulator [Gallionella sp.]